MNPGLVALLIFISSLLLLWVGVICSAIFSMFLSVYRSHLRDRVKDGTLGS